MKVKDLKVGQLFRLPNEPDDLWRVKRINYKRHGKLNIDPELVSGPTADRMTARHGFVPTSWQRLPGHHNVTPV